MLITKIGLATVAILAAIAGDLRGAEAPAADVEAVVDGGNQFALDLYGKLRAQGGNVFCSPYSISSALAMTYAGAHNQTAQQMAKVLHFSLPDPRLHAAHAALTKTLNDEGAAKRGYQLSVANALWGQRGMPFLKEFLDLTQTHYGAGLREVDFATAHEQARATINQWVAQETHDKIKDLLKPGIVDASTRLVLTNAIYFKGTWTHQFKKERSSEAPFKLHGGKGVEVPFMYQTEKLKFAEDDTAQALEMSYGTSDLAMFILLPKQVEGLAQVEAGLNAQSLKNWTGKLDDQMEVAVSLPKFKLRYESKLNDVLIDLGMKDAFTNAADFSGMDGKQDLFLSAVVHQAFVEVNEEGTEAAAATAGVMTLKAMPQMHFFRADHPFLFLIRNTRSGEILFLGRMTDPRG